jgi:hypothetical protein
MVIKVPKRRSRPFVFDLPESFPKSTDAEICLSGKIFAITNPTTVAKRIENPILEKATSQPIKLPVYSTATMFVAGAVYKNAIAGPKPAPPFLIPANNGITVQEHVANNNPDAMAIGYDLYFGESFPKYCKSFPFGIREDIAPAIKNAGTRQNSVWLRR